LVSGNAWAIAWLPQFANISPKHNPYTTEAAQINLGSLDIAKLTAKCWYIEKKSGLPVDWSEVSNSGHSQGQ